MYILSLSLCFGMCVCVVYACVCVRMCAYMCMCMCWWVWNLQETMQIQAGAKEIMFTSVLSAFVYMHTPHLFIWHIVP